MKLDIRYNDYEDSSGYGASLGGVPYEMGWFGYIFMGIVFIVFLILWLSFCHMVADGLQSYFHSKGEEKTHGDKYAYAYIFWSVFFSPVIFVLLGGTF